MSLTGGVTDAVLNDDFTSWCEANASYGDGDLGTPGIANPICP